MAAPIRDDRRALVELLPRLLMRAPRGWGGLALLLGSVCLDRPAFFLLRALVQERDAGDTMTQMEMEADLFNPYATVRPILDALPTLVKKGYVARDGERYAVTTTGGAIATRIEAVRDRYLASLAPVPAADLTRLAATCTAIAHSLRGAPEPVVKAHQARAWRAMPPADAAPMVRLYGAVYALWMARDDAHNTAWRAAGFDGPAFDLLSHIWSGNARSVPTLTAAVRESQRPEDVARGIASLAAAGHLVREGDALHLTPPGEQTRDRIEAETDRVYFAPWPPLSPDEGTWLRATLAAVIAALPTEN